MPSLKTTESRNSYKGIRKLSKKSSKKGSKSSKKNKSQDDNTTEEMMDILNSDNNNSYTGKNHLKKSTKVQPYQNQYQNQNQYKNQNQEHDPLLVSNFVPTDNNGNIVFNSNNKIASLLGGIPQINNIQQIGAPIDTSLESEMNPQMMGQMGQHMGQMGQMGQHMAPQMGQHMGPQMGQHMGPQMGQMGQQMGQHMGPQIEQQMAQQMAQQMGQQMGQQMSSQIDNSVLKNLANLGNIQRIV
jgi:hypothetical protein